MKSIKLFFAAMFILAFAVSVSIVSCSKEETQAITKEEIVTATHDESEANSTFDDVFNEVEDGVATFYYGGTYRLAESPCPTITVVNGDTSVFPKTITLDYGDGCTGHNGRVRKGKIIVTISNSWWIAGSQKSVTYENFFINDRQIEGTHATTFDGFNAQGQPSVTVTVNGKITRADGTFMSRVSTRTRLMTDGYLTPRFKRDDVYSITGSASGTRFNGKTYTTNILEALVASFDCKWIKQGVVETEVTNGETTKTVNINYGTGDCDNQAVVTIDGVAHDVTLP